MVQDPFAADASGRPSEPRPGAFEELRVDQQLCLALQTSDSLVTRLYRTMLDPLDLTHPQYLVLISLWQESGRASMGDLRRLLCMDTGAITPLVKRMEGKGLLLRSRDGQDERRVWVELTAKGWSLREQALEARRTVVRQLPLTDSQIIALRSELQAMNQTLLALLETR
ncbi:ArsR family transcriptional regulator [Caulobacter flavus]|uniref:ArsR family transcriptional regulator n=1 Tax=Caulobacter flavus TaxID=1679497 RepID=A0A2N5CX18_9CAUL|nr:MarR family transcriptional regulator [Caulobacter flavus]AYV47517.1 ArsR family transcriptional regulator [Caulobacter flavus]PLR18358.1 ArsR family transcriptional regulator [Caulobacter flavus]